MFVFIIGFVAALQLPGLNKAQSDLALIRLVINTFSPWFVGVIGAAGVLTALVPGSIILLSIATLFIKNIMIPVIPACAKKEMLLVKLSVPFVMLIALFANSYGGETIVGLLIVGYGLVSQLFPALVFSFCRNNPISKLGAIGGMLIGVMIMFISILTKVNFNDYLPTVLNGLNVGIIALIANLIVTLIISSCERIYLR